MNKNEKAFESSKEKNFFSGALKFSSDYVSKAELFDAASRWTAADKNVLRVSIRQGGTDQHALDFMYDLSGLSNSQCPKGSSVLGMVFKPAFKEYLGGDYMIGWDCGQPTYIVK